jgi:PAS domain-containing protein
MATAIEVISDLGQMPRDGKRVPKGEIADQGTCICPLIALTPYPMWIFDRATLKFLEVNQAAINRYAYSRSEFLNMTILDIRPSEDVLALLRNAVQHPANVSQAERWRHTTRTGELVNVEISSREVSFSGRAAEVVLAIEAGTIASRVQGIMGVLDVNSAATRHFCNECTQKCSLAIHTSRTV